MRHINDRFAFDSLFRKLLKAGIKRREILNFILNKYSLSALVFQERIENQYYRKMKFSEEISADLFELKNEFFREQFLNKLNRLLG